MNTPTRRTFAGVLAGAAMLASTMGAGVTASSAAEGSLCPEGATLISESETGMVCQIVIDRSGEYTWELPAGVTKYSALLVGGGGGASMLFEGYDPSFPGTINELDVLAASGGMGAEWALSSNALPEGEATTSPVTMRVEIGAGGAGVKTTVRAESEFGGDGEMSRLSFDTNPDGFYDFVEVYGGGGGVELDNLVLTQYVNGGGMGVGLTGTTSNREYSGAATPNFFLGGEGASLSAITASDLSGLWEAALPSAGNVISRGGNGGPSEISMPAGPGSGGDGVIYQGDPVNVGSGRDGALILRFAYLPLPAGAADSADSAGSGSVAGTTDSLSSAPAPATLAKTGSLPLSGLLGLGAAAALAGAGLLATARLGRRPRGSN